MSAREEILGRIRSATADVRTSDPAADVAVPWEYGRPTAMPDVLEQFVERVEDYRARVVRCGRSGVPVAVVEALTTAGVSSVVVPPGLDEDWLAALRTDLEVVVDPGTREGALGSRALDEVDAVVTAAAVGIAETGTVVLDHRPDQGRRALSLVPDVHVCVVRVDQVVSDVPEAVGRLADSVLEGLPLTWISGPSATSDIELDRVEGVHGPRTLVVVLAG